MMSYFLVRRRYSYWKKSLTSPMSVTTFCQFLTKQSARVSKRGWLYKTGQAPSTFWTRNCHIFISLTLKRLGSHFDPPTVAFPKMYFLERERERVKSWFYFSTNNFHQTFGFSDISLLQRMETFYMNWCQHFFISNLHQIDC